MDREEPTSTGPPVGHARVVIRTGPDGIRRVDAGELFAGDREVVIVHADQWYRLRVTANGKLILTK